MFKKSLTRWTKYLLCAQYKWYNLLELLIYKHMQRCLTLRIILWGIWVIIKVLEDTVWWAVHDYLIGNYRDLTIMDGIYFTHKLLSLAIRNWVMPADTQFALCAWLICTCMCVHVCTYCTYMHARHIVYYDHHLVLADAWLGWSTLCWQKPSIMWGVAGVN